MHQTRLNSSILQATKLQEQRQRTLNYWLFIQAEQRFQQRLRRVVQHLIPLLLRRRLQRLLMLEIRI